MDPQGKDDERGRFVCPSDRQLALRAKLHTGWSSGKSPGALLDRDEQNAILAVIQRNEQLESAERLRVGRLVERVEKIKQRAAECGPKYCRLCGQAFGILGPSKLICDDCRKPVCSKCSIELHSKETTGQRDILWLCKICSETREMWKKTGAWFFKGIPKYEIPQDRPKTNNTITPHRESIRKRIEKPPKLDIKCADTSSDDDDDKVDNSAIIPGPFTTALITSTTNSPFSTTANVCPDDGQHSDSAIIRKVASLKFQNGQNNSYYDDSVLVNKKESLYNPQVSFTQNNTQSTTTIDWDSISMTGSTTTTATANHKNGLVRRGSLSSSWSMSETSSANSSNNGGIGLHQNCREPPLGWLELSVIYSEADHTLDCSLVRARDLPPMDVAGLADPFCKVNIITEYGTTKQKKWTSTKTVHKTTNPEFNDTIRFLGVEPEELAGSILYVVLLDDDIYGNDFLGAARIHLGPIYNPGPHRMTVPLDPEDQHSLEASMSGPWLNGQILIGLCYNTRKRALVVQIKRCSNLLAKDNNGFSDPFVKLQLKPDSHRKKFKTSIKWRNLNPIYDEEFNFETRPNDLDKQTLIITVWDKDLGKSNDFLGCLMLGANSKGRRLKQYKDCIRLPDYFHEQWHCLSGEQYSH